VTAGLRGMPSRLPRAVWLFGATSLLNDFASEMIYPLLPAFVTRTLGGGALALGVLDGLADSVAAFFKLISGYLADRPRLRGPLVVGGYGIAAAVRPLIAAAGAAWHVVALRATDRIGKGIRTAPRDTFIAEVVPPDLRGRAFGLHRAADHVGAIVGPLAASGLIAAGLLVRQVFWLAAIPGAFAVLAAWGAVGAARREAATVTGARAEAGGGATAVPVSDAERQTGRGPFVTLVAVLALGMLFRAPETLLILRAQDLGVGIALVPILWAALHVVRSSLSYPGGVLVDRWGARRTLLLGWLAYAGLAWAFAGATSVGQAWAVFLAFGLVAALTESPERALVARLAPGGRHGRGFGWYHGSVSAVSLPGAALFGWVYETWGGPFALSLSAAITLVAAAALALSSTGWGRGRSAG
jgi:MFS family permease